MFSESIYYSTARCEDYGIIVRYAPVRFGKPLYFSYITRTIYISMYIFIDIVNINIYIYCEIINLVFEINALSILGQDP